jgi:hypothetical protein
MTPAIPPNTSKPDIAAQPFGEATLIIQQIASYLLAKGILTKAVGIERTKEMWSQVELVHEDENMKFAFWI